MGRDAATGLGVGVGRLPGEVGQGGGKMNCVLAAPAGDFQHGSGRRQHLPQYRQDRIAVARDCGRREGVAKRIVHKQTHALHHTKAVTNYLTAAENFKILETSSFGPCNH